jgi:hypothetical protein
MDEVVNSEFAQVAWRTDLEGNGPRLRLEDLRTGRVRYLDALELETIIWLPEGRLDTALDPSFNRWRETGRETSRETNEATP